MVNRLKRMPFTLASFFFFLLVFYLPRERPVDLHLMRREGVRAPQRRKKGSPVVGKESQLLGERTP